MDNKGSKYKSLSLTRTDEVCIYYMRRYGIKFVSLKVCAVQLYSVCCLFDLLDLARGRLAVIFSVWKQKRGELEVS